MARRSVLPAFVGAGGLLAFALQASPALAAPCLSGTYPSLTVGNGQTIDLCGHVTSLVTVQGGGALVTESGSTMGGVTAQRGAVSVRLAGSRVTGSITAASVTGDASSPPAAVTICGSTIGGSITITDAGGLVIIGGAGGDCTANTINGAIDVSDDDHGLDITDNVVGGTVRVIRDAFSSESLGNPFACAIETCTYAAEVGGNIISGALVCLGNPYGVFRNPSVPPNVVYGATIGQCRNEGTLK